MQRSAGHSTFLRRLGRRIISVAIGIVIALVSCLPLNYADYPVTITATATIEGERVSQTWHAIVERRDVYDEGRGHTVYWLFDPVLFALKGPSGSAALFSAAGLGDRRFDAQAIAAMPAGKEYTNEADIMEWIDNLHSPEVLWRTKRATCPPRYAVKDCAIEITIRRTEQWERDPPLILGGTSMGLNQRVLQENISGWPDAPPRVYIRARAIICPKSSWGGKIDIEVVAGADRQLQVIRGTREMYGACDVRMPSRPFIYLGNGSWQLAAEYSASELYHYVGTYNEPTHFNEFPAYSLSAPDRTHVRQLIVGEQQVDCDANLPCSHLLDRSSGDIYINVFEALRVWGQFE